MAKNKGFHITREMFLQRLNEFAEQKYSGYDASCLQQQELNPANHQIRYTLFINGQDVMIDAYYNKDNTITVNPVNKEPSLSFGRELLEYIKSGVNFLNIEQGRFTCEGIEKSVFLDLKDYLDGLEGVSKRADDDKGDNGLVVSYISEIGDKMTLTYYDHKKKLCFQGYLMSLHVEVKAFLAGYKVYAETVRPKDKATEEKINALINAYLKVSYGNLDDLLKDLLYDALKHIVVRVEFKDYGTWVFPALRALEGRIKQMFDFGGQSIGKKFSMFDQCETGEFALNSIVEAEIGDTILVSNINKCYTYYNRNRHALFHTDQSLATTRRLPNPAEAEAIIYEACRLIEESYCELSR
ncbi:MAG: RNase LS family HEPN domain-containing protein [Clostridiales bacterium]|jgi:hypothetical protein|nr:RNase LS family HEPN domain-containing protein [Clostridiales bacterium]